MVPVWSPKYAVIMVPLTAVLVDCRTETWRTLTIASYGTSPNPLLISATVIRFRPEFVLLAFFPVFALVGEGEVDRLGDPLSFVFTFRFLLGGEDTWVLDPLLRPLVRPPIGIYEVRWQFGVEFGDQFGGKKMRCNGR